LIWIKERIDSCIRLQQLADTVSEVGEGMFLLGRLVF
jgi:hypothetical protein